MLQIREVVMQVHSMLFQEGMDLHSCVMTEKATQLTGRKLVLTVRLNGNHL